MRLQWDENLSIGVKSFDDQHRKIMGIADQLLQVLRSGSSLEDVLELAHEFETLVRDHFKKEEEVMRRFRYPNIRAHCVQHSRFVERFSELLSTYISEERNGHASLSDIEILLEIGMISHIRMTDRALGDYLQPWLESHTGNPSEISEMGAAI